MNKKVALLLVPLLLLPLMSFGYAHFTDKVVKKYKIHVGSLILDFEAIHVDYVKMPDVDNDGMVFGDELLIERYENPDDCTWYVYITCDPITGGFVLNTTMWLHNAGKLPFVLMWDVKWDGPYDDDPCFDPPGPTQDLAALPRPPWSWKMEVFRWHEGVRTGPFAPTQVHYKPCDYLEIKQHINFEQPDPANPDSMLWQKEWQCKWIKLWVEFTAQDVYEEILGSDTVGTVPTP